MPEEREIIPTNSYFPIRRYFSLLEGWVENCPMTGKRVRLTDCRKCGHFTKLDCIFIICGYRGRFSKRRIVYRESESGN